MGKGIITPCVPLNSDCSEAEAQLKCLAVRLQQQKGKLSGNSGGGGVGVGGKSGGRSASATAAVNAALLAFVESIQPPVMDDGGAGEEEAAEYNDNGGDSGNVAECDEAMVEAVQGKFSQCTSIGDGDGGGEDEDEDDCSSYSRMQEGCDGEAAGGGGDAAAHTATAFDYKLSAEQYLFVVAALCQVSKLCS